MDVDHELVQCLASATTREAFWIDFLGRQQAAHIAEIGVLRGEFAETLLRGCDTIRRYHMIDPWRHIPDWNKPANRDDPAFEALYQEAMARTEFAAERRHVHRGKTSEVIADIADGSLDFAYIDGDHTLRGISIDLLSVYPKVRAGGWIGGDDFSPTIWQHKRQFEPTLVFPYAVYFAEAVGAVVHALPFNQFLLHKAPGGAFAFVDHVGRYGDLGLLRQLQ